MRNRIKAAYARAVLFIIRPALVRFGHVAYGSGTVRLDNFETDRAELERFLSPGRAALRAKLERLDKDKAAAGPTS